MPEPATFLTVTLPDGSTWTRLDRLSRDDDGQLTDVCQPCRDHETATPSA
jgi:hypothetical protein